MQVIGLHARKLTYLIARDIACNLVAGFEKRRCERETRIGRQARRATSQSERLQTIFLILE